MSEGTTLGKAWVQIVPSAKGISGSISKLLDGEATSAGISAGTAVGSSMVDTIKGVIAAAGIGAAIKSSLSAGMNFDDEMAHVAAISGATGDAFDTLRARALELGASTKFSASESAEAFKYMAMAGWNVEQMMKGVDGVLSLAAADGLDLGRTSDIVTDALTGFNLKAEDAGHFADVLATASSNANTNVSMMGDTFRYAASIVGSLYGEEGRAVKGMEDTALAVGLMANAGIKAEQAGTYFRSFLTRIATNAGATKTSIGALDVLTQRLGVEFYDSGGKARDFSDVLRECRAAWSGLTSEEQTSYAKIVAGQEAMTGWLSIMNASEESVNDLAAAIDNADGAAERMAGIMQNTLGGAVTSFKSAVEGLQIAAYDKFSAKLTDMVNLARDGVSMITGVVTTGDWTPLKEFGSGLVQNVLTGITEGVPALAAKASELSVSVAEGLKTGVPAAVESVTGVASSLATVIGENVWTFVDAGFTVMRGLADGVLQALPTLTGTAVTLATGFIQSVQEHAPALLETVLGLAQQLAASLADGLKTGIPAVVSVVAGLAESLAGFVLKNIPALLDAGLKIVQGLADGILQALPTLAQSAFNLISAFAQSVRENLPTLLDAALNIAEQFASFLAENLVTAIPAAASGIADFVQYLAGVLLENAPRLIESGLQLAQAVVTGIIDALPSLAEAAVNLMASFGAFIRDNLPSLLKSGLEMVTQLSGSIRENAGKLVDGGIELLKNLAQGFADSLPTLIENIPTIVSTIAGIINDNAPKILAAGVSIIFTLIKGIIQSIPTLIAEFPKIIKAIFDVWNAVNWLSLGSKAVTLIGKGIKSLVTNIPNLVKGIVETAGNVIKNFGWASFGRGVIISIGQGVQSLVTAIPSALKNIAVTAIEWFTKGGWLQAGKDVINGLISGIVGMGASAVEAVKNVGKAILDGIKGLFGIHSPSTVFADIGENLIGGLLQGISDTWKGVTDFFSNRVADITDAFSGLKDRLNTIGGNIIGGLRQGISGAWEGAKGLGNWFRDKIDSLKTTAMEQLDEHSPSKVFADIGEYISLGLRNGIDDGSGQAVMAIEDIAESLKAAIAPASNWAVRVGEEVSTGLANGIEEELPETVKAAKEAAEKVSSNIYSGLSRWADRTTKFERLSLSEQLSMWTEIQKQFSGSSDHWWSVEEKLFDLRESVVKESYDNMASAIARSVKRENLSLSEQLAAWEGVMSRFAVGSEQWAAAEEKVFDLRESVVKESYDNMANAIARSVKRENLSLSEQLAAWEGVMSRFAVGSEQWTAAEEKAYDLRAQLQEEFVSKFKSAAETISDLQGEYQKELAERAKTIAGSYKLFEAVPETEQVNAADLTKNLRGQIKSIRSFYDNLSKLSERDAGDSLVEEIRSMGVGAAGELEALLSMSDRQLSRYADLYEEKQSLANGIALRELDSFGTETASKIQEQLDALKVLYDENAPLVGTAFAEGVASGIRDGMSDIVSAAVETTQEAVDQTRDLLSISPETLPQKFSGQYDIQRQIAYTQPVTPAYPNAYGDQNATSAQALRPAPVNITMVNEVGGAKYERRQYQYRADETTRRGPSFVKT